jgi:hypothetical protein
VTYEDEEVKKDFAEQSRRGKRPIDIGARKRRLELLRAFESLLRRCENEREFSDRIIEDLQIIYGSPQYDAAMKVFRASRSGSS